MADSAKTIPEFAAKIGSLTINKSENKGLEALVVEDHVDMMGCAQLTFNDKEVKWDSIKFGDKVEVSFGDSGDLVFKGFVTGIRHQQANKGNHLVTVVALDETVKMGASRVTKVWEEMTDSDIVSQVISAAGLSPAVDSTSGSNAYVLQRNESNLAFAKRLAARNGYLLQSNAKDGTIDFKKPQFGAAGQKITKDAVLALDYTFSPTNVPPKMKTVGWDYVAKEKVEGTAAAGDLLAIGGGSKATSETSQIWDGEGSFIGDVLVSSATAAKDMAVGELNRLARNYLRGTCRTIGSGKLRAGAMVEFEGLPLNPKAFILSARHVVSREDGYQTELRFASNTRPKA